MWRCSDDANWALAGEPEDARLTKRVNGLIGRVRNVARLWAGGGVRHSLRAESVQAETAWRRMSNLSVNDVTPSGWRSVFATRVASIVKEAVAGLKTDNERVRKLLALLTHSEHDIVGHVLQDSHAEFSQWAFTAAAPAQPLASPAEAPAEASPAADAGDK